MRLYSHFFLYPFFFGWISVTLITISLPFLIDLLRRWNRLAHFWVGIVVFSLSTLIVDLPSQNIAPWEISPNIIKDDASILSHFSIPSTEEHTIQERINFQTKMIEIVEPMSNWSLFRWYYPVSLFLQSFALITGLFVCGLLINYRISSNFVNSERFRVALTSSAAALLVGLLYSLMRFAFSSQKTKFYPSESNPAVDWVIMGLFIVAILFSIACFWTWLGEHLAGIISFVLGGTSILAAWKYEEVLIVLFGRHAGYTNYLAILFGVLALGYIWFLIRPPNARE